MFSITYVIVQKTYEARLEVNVDAIIDMQIVLLGFKKKQCCNKIFKKSLGTENSTLNDTLIALIVKSLDC